MLYVLIISAVIIGGLMPVQAGINAELTRFLQHPFLAAFISFFGGALFLSFLVLSQGLPVAELKRLPSAPPYFFIGGLLGALFVGSSIFLVPKLGATTMMVAYIVGQLIMSVCMDHFGWFGLPVVPVSVPRLVGLVLLAIGLALVMKKTA